MSRRLKIFLFMVIGVLLWISFVDILLAYTYSKI
jgi:hypothetical protein